MKYVLAGGTGRLGLALAAALASNGHKVVVLTRRPRESAAGRGVHEVAWNPDGSTGPWAQEISGADGVVNLAGAGIADARWSAARKELLRASRLLPTRSLVTAIRGAFPRPPVFIQQVGAGYYGASLDDAMKTEASPPGDDFLAKLVVEWESESHALPSLGVRLVTMRSGVVLETGGGALPRMATPFKFFAGGPVASGRQYLSWIHVDDWVRLIVWSLGTRSVSGPLNATAPVPVTSHEFSRALGAALHRPSWAPVPGLVLRLLFGEMADAVLIKGQRVVPKRAQEMGFQFQYPTIDTALKDLLNGR